jgi:hypothetical protein
LELGWDWFVWSFGATDDDEQRASTTHAARHYGITVCVCWLRRWWWWDGWMVVFAHSPFVRSLEAAAAAASIRIRSYIIFIYTYYPSSYSLSLPYHRHVNDPTDYTQQQQQWIYTAFTVYYIKFYTVDRPFFFSLHSALPFFSFVFFFI